eukprot:gene12533-8586_t
MAREGVCVCDTSRQGVQLCISVNESPSLALGVVITHHNDTIFRHLQKPARQRIHAHKTNSISICLYFTSPLPCIGFLTILAWPTELR